MLKKTCAFLLALCLLLTVCGCNGGAGTEPSPSPSPSQSAAPEASPAPEESTEVQLSQRAENWAADISYLKRNYKMYHPDPFYLCSEEEFNWKLDQLAAKVDDLSDSDIFFELSAIIAGMGDIHTAVVAPDSFYDREFPVLVRYLGDKPYLYGYLEGYGQFAPYLLRQIVAVNGVDITYLLEKSASVKDPFNKWRAKELFSLWYFAPAFLDWAGCDYQEGYTLQVLNENQEVESIELPVISLDEYMEADVVWPETWHEPFTFLNQETDRVDYLPGENGGCVYLYIGQMDALHGKQFYQDLLEKAAGLFKDHPNCGKLVIDLRFNPGGATVVADHIRENLPLLKEFSIEQVFVITSGYTTSGGILCLSMFKEELGAVHIGEPTGQFTSFFSHVALTPMVLHLPQSQLNVWVATDWWDGSAAAEEQYDENGRLYPWEYTVLPDVYVSQNIEDIRQGKDSVIEWVLAQ